MAGLTQPQIEYMMAHASDDKAAGFVVANVVCMVGATVAVALRFYARSLTVVSYGWDDVFISIAWIGAMGYTISDALTAKWGMGKHIIFVTDAKSLIISLTVAECFFNFVIMFVKLSILAFYARVFPQRWFHWMIWIVSTIAVVQNVPAIFLTIFQCVPISAQWDPTVKATATCLNYMAVVIAFGALNVATDLLILGMPIPLVWKLQIGANKKWLVIGAFTAGAIACIVDISRLGQSVALHSLDTTYDFVGDLVTSAVELSVGIICACVPLYRPILGKFFKGMQTTQAQSNGQYAKDNTITMKGLRSSRSQGKGWDTISDQEGILAEDDSNGSGGIHVRKEYSVRVGGA